MVSGLQVVIVEWDDAHSDSGTWIPMEEIEEEPCRVSTVGILITSAKPDHVVVAQSVHSLGQDDYEPQFDAILCIPVGMVRSMRVVSESGAAPLFRCAPSGQA
jgi:hypothetical protein